MSVWLGHGPALGPLDLSASDPTSSTMWEPAGTGKTPQISWDPQPSASEATSSSTQKLVATGRSPVSSWDMGQPWHQSWCQCLLRFGVMRLNQAR